MPQAGHCPLFMPLCGHAHASTHTHEIQRGGGLSTSFFLSSHITCMHTVAIAASDWPASTFRDTRGNAPRTEEALWHPVSSTGEVVRSPCRPARLSREFLASGFCFSEGKYKRGPRGGGWNRGGILPSILGIVCPRSYKTSARTTYFTSTSCPIL